MDSTGTWLKKSRTVETRRMLQSFNSCCQSTTDTKANWPRTLSTDPDLQSIVSAPPPYPNKLFSAYEQPYEPLQLVQIYFDTATFDEISRDVKNTMETQISVIGGTMGLFTGLQLINEIVLGVGWLLKFLCPGFSILSGVEIIYFVAKFLIGIFTNNKKKKSHAKC